MAPRWKGKAAAVKALAVPMSQVVSRLQSSLIESNSQGMLAGLNVLLAVHPEQTELLHHACFGRPVATAEKDNQWFQLSLEEALYLCFVMRCIKIFGENACAKSNEELWLYTTTVGDGFHLLFIAYSHLRAKNWVVRPGAQYGVDFVAYRHHPALVHSEYAVLVSSDEDGNGNDRLRVWSDYHCTLRLCGSVAKTLLVLHIGRCRNASASPWSLEHYQIEERIITRWNPELSCEKQTHSKIARLKRELSLDGTRSKAVRVKHIGTERTLNHSTGIICRESSNFMRLPLKMQVLFFLVLLMCLCIWDHLSSWKD